MKKIYFLLILTVSVKFAFGQCPTSNITLTTQAQVNNFITTYPNCSVFNNSVVVTGNGITNLNGLSNLTKVGGLSISNTSLTDLTGCNNLTEAGSISLWDNFSLTSVNGLNSLTRIRSSLTVANCFAFTDISALANLTKIEEIALSNVAVTSLNGLNNIDSLSSLGLQACEFLSDINALDDVKFKPTLISSLVFIGNPVLSDCVGDFICAAASGAQDSNPVIIGSNDVGCNTLTEVKNNCLIAMPVKLVQFNAKTTDNNYVVLSWATSSEANSKNFEIHKSEDGRTWGRLGTVNAQGESSTTVQYTFQDKSPSSGNNFYRLKMIDLDGSYSYSKIVNAKTAYLSTFHISPNPVSDLVKFSDFDMKSIKSISIFDMSGKEVHKQDKVDSNEISVKDLPTGLFVMHIVQKNGVVIDRKFLKRSN
ncbi:T9SS type A sorting domain-containing protein [Dyadobacter crusticola]|uniref:T9SS type A sorting domain-containing protein n=1 Tax=Dyadobacter crusticola TaxID=292407 RepID=UPI0004E1EFC3|nr:T9SS type A sorting domain-containing protein [Dyadobacter crusticola]